MEPDSFPETEALGDAHVKVDERRRDELTAALQKIYSIEIAVPINVRRFNCKPAL
ncbi:MAG TPA: hypothetical protein VJO16_05510 [Candidatus Acidoferrum sp.]|nr:hypothetical protein [Candidatus Acidoferrum sp.]